jgi:ABC-type nitrate/sulfonate/bicarbonate transport system substrate-binding protein
MASGPAPETANITIDVVPTADAAGLYIAYDDGYFKRQGINLKIVSINGGEFGMGDLQTGKADLVEGNNVSFILAQIAGKFAAPTPTAKNPAATAPVKPINMRMIADTSQMQEGNQALYVLPNSPYKTVSALTKDHATVGINSPNNIAQVLLGSLFAADGLSLSKIRQVVQPWPSTRSTRPGCPSRSVPRPSRTTAPCNWPTSTRARWRTSRSAPSSATLRGCSRTPTRSRRSCARSTRVSRSRTATARQWSRRS